MAGNESEGRSRSRSRDSCCCKAILLDLDDTLVETTAIDREAIASAAQLALEREPALSDAEALITRFKALLKAEPFPPESSDATLQEWRTSLWARALERAEGALAAEVHDHWTAERLRRFKFSDDVQALLKRLAGTYRLGIVTNGHADVQRPKLAACNAAAFVGEQGLVVSGEQPQAKPHPSIFLTACARLGVAPGEAVMVGDSLAADVQGGLAAGLLATVWVRGAAAAPAEGPRPTRSVGSVLELEAALASIHRPELARVGGVRGHPINTPEGDGEGGKIYNGTTYATPRFFSRQEVQELVAFASALEIEVVPEIDVPAHAAALIIAARSQGKDLGTVELHEGCSAQQGNLPLTAPPNCMGGTHGLIVPTQDALSYVLGAIEEVAGLFPGPYFHLGGDEADEFRDEVYASEAAEKLKSKLNISSSTGLQGYMVDEVHRLLTRLGKTAIAWDETHVGLEEYKPPQDMLAMWWRDWSPEAPWEVMRDLGPQLILAPCSKMYMDIYQMEPHSASRHRVQDGTVPLRSTYSAAELEAENVLGVHGCLWSEHLTSHKALEYQLFPRGAAVAEVAWTPKARATDFDGFLRRWSVHAERLAALGVEYYDGNYTGDPPQAAGEQQPAGDQQMLENLDDRLSMLGFGGQDDVDAPDMSE